jgi:hypothetical protein
VKHSLPIESERKQKSRAYLTKSKTSPVSQAFVDNREATAIRRQLMAKMDNSPQAIAQRMLSEQRHNSSQMLVQRQQIAAISGGAVQRVEGEEELMQGKFNAIQRVEEEEELMQGKFNVTQRVEEEELLQGKFDVVQHVEEEELLQGQFSAAQLEQKPSEKLNNTGLPDNLKCGVENLSGMSMDNVKVHYNSSKPAQLNALAYAQGTDIHLGTGQKKHLPHEAWHVVQQAQGRVKPTMQMKDGVPVNDDQALEHEADVMGREAATQMKSSPDSSLVPKFLIVQRVPRETDVGHAEAIAAGHSLSHKPKYLSDEKWKTRITNTIKNGEQKVLTNDRTAYYLDNGWTVVLSPTDPDQGTAVKTKNKNWFNNLA